MAPLIRQVVFRQMLISHTFFGTISWQVVRPRRKFALRFQQLLERPDDNLSCRPRKTNFSQYSSTVSRLGKSSLRPACSLRSSFLRGARQFVCRWTTRVQLRRSVAFAPCPPERNARKHEADQTRKSQPQCPALQTKPIRYNLRMIFRIYV